MKTLNEIYDEVMANDEVKAKFAAIKSAEEAVALIKELGGDADADEIAVFLKEKAVKKGELTDAELNQVAGGKGFDINELVISIGGMGIYCAVTAVRSAINGHVGTGIEGDGMLCDA